METRGLSWRKQSTPWEKVEEGHFQRCLCVDGLTLFPVDLFRSPIASVVRYTLVFKYTRLEAHIEGLEGAELFEAANKLLSDDFKAFAEEALR